MLTARWWRTGSVAALQSVPSKLRRSSPRASLARSLVVIEAFSGSGESPTYAFDICAYICSSQTGWEGFQTNSAQVSENTGVCVRPHKGLSVGEAGGGGELR